MKRLEYTSVCAPIDRTQLDILGLNGWQLCAVDGAIAWLSRDRDARVLDEQAADHAKQRGDK